VVITFFGLTSSKFALLRAGTVKKTVGRCDSNRDPQWDIDHTISPCVCLVKLSISHCIYLSVKYHHGICQYHGWLFEKHPHDMMSKNKNHRWHIHFYCVCIYTYIYIYLYLYPLYPTKSVYPPRIKRGNWTPFLHRFYQLLTSIYR